jgi:hypothetical protein
MNAESREIIRLYWKNESRIKGLERKADASVDQIVEHPNLFSKKILNELKSLLETNKGLLIQLAPIQLENMRRLPVVDMGKYRKLAKLASI